MRPIVDPRRGDIEDDASSTKQRSLVALAGSLLAEISLPKLLAAWVMLILLPVLVLGLVPLIASIWIGQVSAKAALLFTGLWPALVLAFLLIVGWFAGRPFWRLLEANFWSLNALAVQPGYVLAREALRHLAERFLLGRGADIAERDRMRAASALIAGLLVSVIALWFFTLAFPHSRWTGTFADVAMPARLAFAAFCNAVVIVAAYVAVVALVWAFADATMPQPHDTADFPVRDDTARWRVAHLSDIHIVGERYGFRVESGRAGPRGNERLEQLFAVLEEIHRGDPLNAILISGDVTDAGRSAEWAVFFDLLERHPSLAPLVAAIPGNHDLNVVDRANPARLDLPTSPNRRLRQARTLSALGVLQGRRAFLVDEATGKPSVRLDAMLETNRVTIAALADKGRLRDAGRFGAIWLSAFPMVIPPAQTGGLGLIALNSNAETHFSFTNALGLVSRDETRAMERVLAAHPGSPWIIALHHHLVEYPRAAASLSERIGTALVDGTWFVRRLSRFAGRVVVMHGHRHIDWMGECGGVPVISAPSPVMSGRDADETWFYVHNLGLDGKGRLRLLRPDRVRLPGATGETPP